MRKHYLSTLLRNSLYHHIQTHNQFLRKTQLDEPNIPRAINNIHHYNPNNPESITIHIPAEAPIVPEPSSNHLHRKPNNPEPRGNLHRGNMAEYKPVRREGQCVPIF